MLGGLLFPRVIWHKNRRKILEKMYKYVIVEDNGLNLDVGCGEGFTLSKMFHVDTIGIDVDRSLAAHRHGDETKMLMADAHSLPFHEDSFDIVTCLNVLEFSPHPEVVLKEIHGVVKIGGALLCLQPVDCLLLRFLWFFWVRTFGRKWAKWRIRRLKRSRLLSLIEERFEVEAVHFTNLGMLIGVVCRKTFQPTEGIIAL